MRGGSLQQSSTVIFLTLVFISLRSSLAAFYSLDATTCSNAVDKIGNVLSSKISEKTYKGKFVSARCELRPIQESSGNGMKAAFLLRSIDVVTKRRWVGNYFFYRDEDCVHATYGLKIQGKLKMKNTNVVMSISSLSVAIFSAGFNHEIHTKFNRSCRGNLTKSDLNSKHLIYSVSDVTPLNNECLKALGIEATEFSTGASFVTNHPPGSGKSDELIQSAVNLARGRQSGVAGGQWPLVRHNKVRCLTCAKVGLSRFKYPPRLYVRNSTSLDGTWATSRCHRINTNFWATRVNSFSGNTFQWTFYHMDPSTSKSPHRCSQALVEYRISGNLRKVGRSPEVPGAVIYEMFITHASLTPRTKLYESVLNGLKKGTCGTQQWHLDHTQDIMPTIGCKPLGFSLPENGGGILSLIRTVTDDGRKEMYFAADASTTTGPLKYQVLLESCNTFPINMPTTPTPNQPTVFVEVDVTTESNEEFTEQHEEEAILVKEIKGTKPTSSASRHISLLQYLLMCLLGSLLRLF